MMALLHNGAEDLLLANVRYALRHPSEVISVE